MYEVTKISERLFCFNFTFVEGNDIVIAMMEPRFEANVLRCLSHILTAIKPDKLYLVGVVEKSSMEYTIIMLIVVVF